MGDLSMVRHRGSGPGARSAGPRVRRRSALRAFAPALGAILASAAFAAQASAVQFVRPAGAVGNGQLFRFERDANPIHQQRIAVEHSTGYVLVTDIVNDEIDVYDGTTRALLTSFGAGELTDPFGIAIDQRTGAVYISDSGRNRIVRYTVTAGAPPTYALDGAFTSPAQGSGAGQIGRFAAALAIDPSSDKLLVADPGNNLVKRYTLAGAYDNFSFDGTGSAAGTFRGLLDLAVDSTGDVIVVDSTGDVARGAPATSRVLRFSASGAHEGRIGATLSRAATVAVRPAGNIVIVSANQDSVNLLPDQPPSVNAFSVNGAQLTTIRLPSFNFVAAASLDYSVITGIASDDGPNGRLFISSDVDRASGDRWGAASVQIYDAAPATPPTISDQRATTTASSAAFSATVNPNGSQVSYHFEYGLAGVGYTERTADATLAAGTAPRAVGAAVTGLPPATEYQFRIVVDNGEGTFTGARGTFVTLPLPPTAVANPVTGVTRAEATLHAALDLRGAPGSYAFVIQQVGGPFRVEFPRVDVPAGGPVTVSQRVEGLSPGQTYRAGISVLTDGGYALADPVTFTTPGVPPVDDPARRSDTSPLYGCAAPRLDAVSGPARVGQELAVTGADLGVYGSVHIGGEQATIRSYSADRVTFLVPEGLSGRVDLSIDCGKATGTVPVTIAGGGKPGPKLAIAGATVRGKVATLRVRVPAAGTVTARGRHVSRATARLGKSGTATLKVRLTRAGSRALSRARGKRLRVTIVVRHAPRGGRAATVRKAVVFKR